MASLENAGVILRLINRLKRQVTVTDLVDNLGMPKSSASRLLRQMAEEGFLERDPLSRAFGPALIILELSRLVRSTTQLFPLLQKALEGVCLRSGHTGYVSMLDGVDVLVLFVRSGSHPLQLLTYPGHRAPAWATSTGRALLARQSDDEVRQRFGAALPTVSANAPADADALLARLAEVRAQGFADALDESIPGVGSVSCAVGDPTTGEHLALCLSFPSASADAARVRALGMELRTEAAGIGRLVGDPSWGR
ncbi:MAG: IclR family transcriptional regulator [Janthinobacterium lividum]